MNPSDFFYQVPDDTWDMREEFNSKLANQLRRETLEESTDLEAAHALAVRTLKAVLRRLGISFDPPFNDFEGWHGYWSAQGMTHGGSWALRRGYVNDLLTPVLASIEELENTLSDSAGFGR
jgi:hypothetical protein